MTTSQAQRNAYRYALEDAGVPEVIAFMAARNLDVDDSYVPDGDSYALIWEGFAWKESPEGF
jgi:hypothetical protein